MDERITTGMQYHFDDITVDSDQFALLRDGNSVHVEPQVIELILYLLQHRGRMVSRDELNREVWRGRVVTDSALSTRIKLARQVLGDDGSKQKYIRTVRKKGFVFNTDVDVSSNNAVAPTSTDASARGAGRRARPALAVTRLVDQSDASGQSVISEGISDDIITTLSRISQLTVLTFPAPVDGSAVTAQNPRRQQAPSIDYRLEGSVRCEGERLRISVHLVEERSGRHIWAQRYDRRFRSLFELQDDITREVVSALQVELTDGEQALLASRGTEDIEAWKLTFEGQAAVLDHRQHSVRRGLQLLEKALALDPHYVLAWSALATGHWKESLNTGWSLSPVDSLQKAIDASDRGLRLEPLNASALAVRGLVLVSLRRFDDALGSARKAIYHARSEAHTLAIASLVLRSCCEPVESIAHMQKAMRLCPLYPAWYPYSNAICYWMQKRYDEALAAIEEAIRIDAGLSLNFMVLAMIRAETGQRRAAADAVASLLGIEPDFRIGTFSSGVPFRDDAIEARRQEALSSAGLAQ